MKLKLSKEATIVLEQARMQASNKGQESVSDIIILMCLLIEKKGLPSQVIGEILSKNPFIGTSVDDLINALCKLVKPGISSLSSDSIQFDPISTNIMDFANDEALRLDHKEIGLEHLMLGLVKLGKYQACGTLVMNGISLQGIKDAIENRINTRYIHMFLKEDHVSNPVFFDSHIPAEVFKESNGLLYLASMEQSPLPDRSNFSHLDWMSEARTLIWHWLFTPGVPDEQLEPVLIIRGTQADDEAYPCVVVCRESEREEALKPDNIGEIQFETKIEKPTQVRLLEIVIKLEQYFLKGTRDTDAGYMVWKLLFEAGQKFGESLHQDK